jgi:tetratricopeptide (TPR) repeat protein
VSPIDLLLSQANDRLSLKKYAEAVALIDESIARDANFDTIEVRKALVASLLGSKDYVRAGQLLASINIVSSQQLEWNLLYTIWLFHASAESRSEVLALLREHALQNGQSDEVLGKIAWIEARSKNPSVALAILAKTARAARCSFGDALFYSVALQYAGQAEQALEQLDRAEQMVNSELSELSGSSISDAALLSYAEPTVQRALVAYRASLAR